MGSITDGPEKDLAAGAFWQGRSIRAAPWLRMLRDSNHINKVRSPIKLTAPQDLGRWRHYFGYLLHTLLFSEGFSLSHFFNFYVYRAAPWSVLVLHCNHCQIAWKWVGLRFRTCACQQHVRIARYWRNPSWFSLCHELPLTGQHIIVLNNMLIFFVNMIAYAGETSLPCIAWSVHVREWRNIFSKFSFLSKFH